MKRSDINSAVERAISFFASMSFSLPPFAFWTSQEWCTKGHEYDEIRETRIGWDVTDFGSGDFPRIGRTIFTLRNGSVMVPGYPKSYAQKVMMLEEGQRAPIHFHASKMEDIVNQGGGNILISLWNVQRENSLSDTEVEVSIDGRKVIVAPGEPVRLRPGESICLVPRTYHQFWAEEECGTTLSGEVSSVCNDRSDNFFLEKMERFPTTEEDEPIRHYLCHEYPPAPL